MERTYTAFCGHQLIVAGSIQEVALATHAWQRLDKPEPVVVFQDPTGRVIDLDLRGEAADVLARLSDHPYLDTPAVPAPPKRGRPKLGVVSREVSLLPRHWDWLRTQPKSASATLRLLVEEAMKVGAADRQRKQSERSVYGVMTVLAGDAAGFEEASRALFAGDYEALGRLTQKWPADVHAYLERLVANADA